jgi:hypothetical protein
MRFLAALLVAAASSAALAQPFAAAGRHGGDPTAPSWLTFADGDRTCRVAPDGRGVCTRPGRRPWPFRLPTDDGWIVRLYATRDGEDLLIAYELDNGESGWSEVVRMNRGARKPAWKVFIGAFNLDPPVREGRSIAVSADDRLRARLDAATGAKLPEP